MAISDMFGGNLPAGTGVSTVDKTTNYQYDPTQDFVYKLLRDQMSKGEATVDPAITNTINSLATNPGQFGDMASGQFASIAAPLLDQQQAGFKIQNQNTADAFRKAGVGSMQSGAFAQATRQQAADQGRQQQALLAANYIPLIKQMSDTSLGAVNAGIRVPDANSGSLSSILAAISRAPISEHTSGTSTAPLNGTASGGYTDLTNYEQFNKKRDWLMGDAPTTSPVPGVQAPDGWTPGEWSGW